MNRFATPLVLAALLALGAAASAPARASTGHVTIEIGNFQFSPAEITVDPGTMVEWVNHDQTIHNIVLTTAKVASPGMDTGDHYTFTFDTPGDYTYLCACIRT